MMSLRFICVRVYLLRQVQVICTQMNSFSILSCNTDNWKTWQDCSSSACALFALNCCTKNYPVSWLSSKFTSRCVVCFERDRQKRSKCDRLFRPSLGCIKRLQAYVCFIKLQFFILYGFCASSSSLNQTRDLWMRRFCVFAVLHMRLTVCLKSVLPFLSAYFL